ncbi:MAG: hypothetical protein IKJ81_10865 [Bacteroidales bacterium]|nr:hypothetical protein [Bacteroidales bacterium]
MISRNCASAFFFTSSPIVTPKQYKAFRQMMQDWNTYKTVTIKSALGKTN